MTVSLFRSRDFLRDLVRIHFPRPFDRFSPSVVRAASNLHIPLLSYRLPPPSPPPPSSSLTLLTLFSFSSLSMHMPVPTMENKNPIFIRLAVNLLSSASFVELKSISHVVIKIQSEISIGARAGV